MMRGEVDKNRLNILTVVTIKMDGFLDARPCRLVEQCRHFRGFLVLPLSGNNFLRHRGGYIFHE
jgi:hypothetical protein